jgi:hypothetical protein
MKEIILSRLKILENRVLENGNQEDGFLRQSIA